MSKIKIIAYYILLATVFTLIGWFANTAYNLPKSSNNPIKQVTEIIKPTPLAKYSIENLSYTKVDPSKIEIGEVIKEYPKFTSYKFSFSFDPSLSNGSTKKVSGVLNIPNSSSIIDSQVNSNQYPVIIMFRGYVDPTKYFMGTGTQPAATIFANNGFITIAPDFLGYAESNKEAEDIFESRFQTYTTAATLIKSVEALNGNPLKVVSNNINIDTNNIFIWGHSNGGQIALTTLEITGAEYPTVLWAPVSKPFPYSILYYTDDADDHGKFLRQKLSDFEDNYDVEKFSLTNYLNNIKAPIQLNQGTSDDAVPLTWSNLLAKELLSLNIDLDYTKYPGADHNMRPSWDTVVLNNLHFYQNHLK